MHHIREDLIKELTAAGAVAVGFAKADLVDEETMLGYEDWIAQGNHAGMDYLPRHAALKRDPHNVLDDASTVVCVAFSYYPKKWRDDSLPYISAYAYGEDYHETLRKRLEPIVTKMKTDYGGDWRICIDSAPLAERYWAVRSGIGKRGVNGSVIVNGYGSFVFLAEILTSHPLFSDTETGREYTSDASSISCLKCGKCLEACPTGALLGDGTLDSRRCINYLTIEHKGEWTEEGKEAMLTDAGRNTLFGCDVCQKVCPHNIAVAPTTLPEFSPRKEIIPGEESVLNDKESLLSIGQTEFSRLFKGSPIKRARLAGFHRNASNLKKLS